MFATRYGMPSEAIGKRIPRLGWDVWRRKSDVLQYCRWLYFSLAESPICNGQGEGEASSWLWLLSIVRQQVRGNLPDG